MDRWTRRMAIASGTAALAAMGALTACSPTNENEAPATSSTSPAAPSSSSAPAVTPTAKAVGPGGGNSFSPTIDPTAPGSVCKQLVDGVCIR